MKFKLITANTYEEVERKEVLYKERGWRTCANGYTTNFDTNTQYHYRLMHKKQ
jgi:hypothetical protein